MIKATIKYAVSSLFVMLLAVSLTTNSYAQFASYGPNLIENGDFSADTLGPWVDEVTGKGNIAIVNGELAITGLTEQNNIYDAQVNQPLSAEDIAALAAGGTYEVSFDARASTEAKNIHVFLGEVGGGWARYFAPDGDGLLSIGNEMQTYKLQVFVLETWESMRLGFEISSDTASIWIDNVRLAKVEDNIVGNGDFSLGDSLWNVEGGQGTVSFDNGELAFTGITGEGNPWELQANQPFDSVQLAAISNGPYSISFDARTTEGTQDIHLFIGEVGGGWSRYLSPDEGGAGRITVGTEMTTYVREFAIEETWPSMRLGFEVNYGAGDVFIDNVVFKRVEDVIPDAPAVNLTTEAGVVTIAVTDNGAASYDVFFADTAFTDMDGGAFVGTIDPANGLSITHTTKAPHPTLVDSFDAYYGVVARSEKGSASDLTGGMINTSMTVAENYIVELSLDDADAILSAVDAGTMLDGATVAGFFPENYQPFTINEGNIFLQGGSLPENDADLSAKFWMGFETGTGADFMIVYSEITDNVLIPTPNPGPNGGGAGWQYDSWEMGIGAYSPASFITGSDHGSYEAGAEPDYQWRAGVFTDASAYMHGYNINVGSAPLDQGIPNSATIADTTADGVYRMLSIVSTIELSGIVPENANFSFPTGTGVTTIPLAISVNDADDGTRETQVSWSQRAGFGDWWNTPSSWETIALVGADAVPTSNEEDLTSTPVRFSLEQNYPNPFNPSTNIQFSLPSASDVTLEVFNMLGQKVATILDGEKLNAGSHTQKFDASSLASGMYVYRISAANFVQSRKMMLIK